MCEPKSSGLSDASLPGATADDVAGEVDRRIELRGAHPFDHDGARRLVDVAVGNARHAALRVLSELGERGEVRVDALAVHAELGLRPAQRRGTALAARPPMTRN